MVSPDDICGVCQTKRDEHGDRQHEFNIEGQLIPKKKPEPGRPAPQAKGESPAQQGVESERDKAFLRLMEVLLEKGVIDGRDTIQILGGPTS